MRVVLVVVVAAACGSKGSNAPAVCNHIAKVCGETYTTADVEKCAADWPTFQKDFGAEITATFVACTNDAKTCTEAQQCSRAAVTALRATKKTAAPQDPADPRDPLAEHRDRAEAMRERFEQARDQDPFKHDPFFHDTAPLPPECARADELCPKDEPFARRQCRTMVGDLQGDAKHLGELTRCYANATSCAAFKKCRDEMWFELH